MNIQSKFIVAGIVIIVVSSGFFVWQKFFHNPPQPSLTFPPKADPPRAEREGEGTKHSVPLEEILSGGPPKDGIPSIDNPQFIAPEEASAWLDNSEPGIAFSRGDTHRFYPYQILVWHEIVNDTVPSSAEASAGKEGERVLVTYCPLCLTGFVFDPLVPSSAEASAGKQGERVEFGTSGKLWKSNLVMYDRKTESLWSQILGEAIVGELTGTKLTLLPSDQVEFGKWREIHPDGQVLSRETGATRFYGTSPYGDYFTSTSFARSLAGGRDTRLTPDAFVFGIVVNGKAKAYPAEAVKQKGELTDEFEKQTFVLRYDKELEVVRVYRRLSDGSEERINPFSSFWFAWTAAHPDTEVYQ